MGDAIRVECVYAGPGICERREVVAGAPLSVERAVALSGLAQWLAERDLPVAGYAVFGRKAEPEAALTDGDRLELLRPLQVTPTEARRLRAAAKRRGRDGVGSSNDDPR